MKDQHQWIRRLISLALVVAALGVYQSTARGWEKEQTENQEQVEAAEAHNAQVLAEEAERSRQALLASQGSSAESLLEEAEEDVGPYTDGSYTGSGEGFGGTVTVTVTVEGGYMTDITVDDASGEDGAYFSMAVEILDTMLDAQSADVDTVSGATFSSTGLKTAVAQALTQAEG